MSLVKRIGKNERIRGFLCWLAAWYIRLCYYTGRWEHLGRHIPEQLQREGKPFLVALWHSRLMMTAMAWIGGGTFHMMISHHRDGRLIARTVAHLGIGSVDGSTSQGGASALRAMVRMLKAGHAVGITPDGPRGPRQRASAGMVEIARLAGALVVPLTYSCRGRRLKSWDRFHLPYPFARGVFIWGEPIAVPRDCDVEETRRRIEDILNAQMEQADRMVGMDPVPPAEEAV